MNLGLLQNSLLVAGLSALLATFLGALGGAFAATLNRPFRFALTCAAVASLTIPPFMVVNTWMNYFGLNGTWRVSIPFNLYTNTGAILLLTLLYWPISFLLVSSASNRIDPTSFEQEPGLQGFSFFRYILWPTFRPALIYSLAFGFVLTLNNFTVPTLLQAKVFSEEVWLSFSSNFDYLEALRLSWPLILGPLLLLWWIHSKPVRFQFRHQEICNLNIRRRLGLPFVLFAAFTTTVLILLSVAFPLFQIISSPRTWSQFWPAMEAGKFATWNSILFAGGSALVCVILAILLRNLRMPFVTWVLYLTPGVLLGIAIIWMFNRPILVTIYQSVAIVIAVFTLRYIAIAWSAGRAALLQSDRRLIEAVQIFGGNQWARFRYAEWPQTKFMVLVGFYLVFLFCLWEVETLILIVPAGRETLALRIFNMLHYGHAAQVDALCLWLLIIALAPIALYAVARSISKFITVRALIPIALVALCSSGCSPNSDAGTRVKSTIFSSVQIIGSRGTGVGQFNKPRSVALDRDDNLYVIDMTGRVQKFSPDGKFLLLWQMPEVVKGKPKGMVRDIDGNIILVEPHYSRVNHFDQSGHLVAQWGTHGTNVGQLYFPRSAAINSRGDIYITEYGMTERIQCFTQFGKKVLFTFGTLGGGPGQIDRAEGMGMAPDDTLFVADSCNHRIQVFSAEGKFLREFGRAGSGLGEFSYPYDVRIDPTGLRYVCEFGNHRVQVFNEQNQPIEILGGPGADPSQMNNPWSIDFDSAGNLYIADSGNHRVLKYIRRVPLKPSGTSTLHHPNSGQEVASVK
jgi:ABC-type Fe3+ transport system permease subunit/DNA-binding beta-propeller fold protein YncE